MKESHVQMMESHRLAQQKEQKPKKLRFITSHGAPHPKRRRVSSACLTCRKRKIACSGERPSCNTCAQNKIECRGYVEGDGNTKPPSKDKAEKAITSEQKPRRESASPLVRRSSSSFSTFSAQQPSVPNSNIPQSLLSDSNNANQQQQTRILSDIQEEPISNTPASSLASGPRNRMPYFRWLGPTAIMPGFKQMVVKVKRQDTSNGVSSNKSNDGLASPNIHRTASVLSATSLTHDDVRTPLTLPFYDTSSMPPSELITHLVTTFFIHLGCNFPFLQRDRFLKDLEEKQVDTILVDAVCSLAARFSNHHLLTQQANQDSSPSEYGSAFAQRAKEALMHTYATPSVAAVQAALLIAYNEFGESRDSGLWMYLGIAIRLAQDLGLQKLDGLRYEGRNGPTPKMVKNDNFNFQSDSDLASTKFAIADGSPEGEREAEEKRACETERIDTFWAVFFLDRVVSSGTGRRSTLRDKDIELSFPSLETKDPQTGWPMPFPALIRIVHLYGRVADLLNGIKEASDVTEETSRRLGDMEARVTHFYQGLSSKLHFQAMNFHHYVKAGQGTNFVLLHFWFHTLIVLLHQPTLFKTFEGKMLQLFPNSQQLSMSSAKTIADILSYSQLIDTKANLGNPFTTQPIYIAACAFLKETAEQTATSKEQSRTQSASASHAGSRAHSPQADIDSTGTSASRATFSSRGARNMESGSAVFSPQTRGPIPLTHTDRIIARHNLLATAASQHYQLCFKALESLEVYWAGTKYILTVLDQKFKGVGDPLLYTAEEGESSLERPNPKAEEAFKMPGWRRKSSWGPNYASNNLSLQNTWLSHAGAGGIPGIGVGKNAQSMGSVTGSGAAPHDPNQAIGWTLTGTLNSPSTNLAWHFPSMYSQGQQQHHALQDTMMHHQQSFDFDSALQNPPTGISPGDHTRSAHTRASSTGSIVQNQHQRPRMQASSSFDTTNLLLDPALSFPQSAAAMSALPMTTPFDLGSTAIQTDSNIGPSSSSFLGFNSGGNLGGTSNHNNNSGSGSGGIQGLFDDMFIESQDVDTSMLLGLDTLPWFEALPGNGSEGGGGLEMVGDFGGLEGEGQGQEQQHEQHHHRQHGGSATTGNQ